MHFSLRLIVTRLLRRLNISVASTSKVKKVWDRQTSAKYLSYLNDQSWVGLPQIHLNHNYQVTGDRNRHWMHYLLDCYFEKGFAGDVLSLGCGAGHVGRLFKYCGFQFRSFTGLDISPKSIDKAREEAAKVNLAPRFDYVVADLNDCDLPEESYDFIYFYQSLHHIKALERILSRTARALRKEGLLLVCDFVGPSRFQWREKQLEMADELIRILPDELKRDLRFPWPKAKNKTDRPTKKEMIAGDPSEAVRSGEIEAILKEHFEIVEEKNWGGTLNHLIFQNIAGNFDQENPYHRAIIELLIHHENVLIKEGIIPSDFKFIIARPRKTKKD